MPVAPLPLQKFARQSCCGLVGEHKLRIRNGLLVRDANSYSKLIFLMQRPEFEQERYCGNLSHFPYDANRKVIFRDGKKHTSSSKYPNFLKAAMDL
jgi:hypothetical protein